jgi:N utilization substance protein A
MVDDEYDRVIFVVASGRGGRAIGKNGNNIKKVRESIRKEIDVVEHSENINEFIMNIFRPVSIHDVEIIESVAYIKISRVEKGIAIGRGGRNIQKAKTLVQKYYGLDDIIIR